MLVNAQFEDYILLDTYCKGGFLVMKYEPVLRKPTEEEEELFTSEFLESLFEES